MIEGLVPARTVSVHTATRPIGDPASALFPEEAAAVAGAVRKRQEEFATVRFCARTALARLGHAPAPLLTNRRGAPQWPAGVVGSMTHCDGYRAAAVARASAALSVGIDAEPNAPLPHGVLGKIALPAERERLGRLSALRPAVHWARLLFSAKESVFKVWYPLTGRELDFTEAEVTIEPGDGTFSARLLVPGPVVDGRRLELFGGRWAAGDGLVVSAIVLPAPEPGGTSGR